MDLFKILKQQSHEFITPSNSNTFFIPKKLSLHSHVFLILTLNLCSCISTVISIMNNTLMNCPLST